MEILDGIPEIVTVLISTVIVVTGWVIGHILNSRRDQRNKRRELVIDTLSNACLAIAPYFVTGISPNNCQPLQKAQVNIQLIGTPKMAKLASDLGAQVEPTDKGSRIPLGDLLSELRKELRKELGLDPVDEEINFINVT